MTIDQQIADYIAGQPATKRRDLQTLHALMLRVSPGCRLWFLDGRNEDGRIVSNPNIGYGIHTMRYASGKTRDFYRVGLSANTTGVSLYVMGIDDRTYLARTYGETLGRASISGYCIKFRTLDDVDIAVIEDIVRFAFSDRG